MHIVIVEDEPAIAERIERLTVDILGDTVNRIRHFPDVDGAIDYLLDHAIDLLLLDLKLTGRSGFEVLKGTAAESFQTIIISAFAEQAITAFEWGVLDFVNKPFARKRLETALNRFLDTESRARVGTRYLSVKVRNRIEVIDIDSVLYLKGSDNYSELVLKNGETRLHDKPLLRLEMILPTSFIRIHRSFVVNVNQIAKLHTYRGGKYEIELAGGTVLPVGRTRYKAIKALFA